MLSRKSVLKTLAGQGRQRIEKILCLQPSIALILPKF